MTTGRKIMTAETCLHCGKTWAELEERAATVDDRDLPACPHGRESVDRCEVCAELASECVVLAVLSRACERGTKGCRVRHGAGK